jgi:hypothetical protein
LLDLPGAPSPRVLVDPLGRPLWLIPIIVLVVVVLDAVGERDTPRRKVGPHRTSTSGQGVFLVAYRLTTVLT